MKLILIASLIVISIPFILYFILIFTLVIWPKFKVDKGILKVEKKKDAENIYTIGENWIKRNSYGIWEHYITKNGFENGAINGMLCKENIEKQEAFFVDEIKRIVPSNMHTFILKVVIGYINRKIERYIPMEYLLEIYGVSLSASKRFNYITNNYQRYLNYHAANDIAHAVEDLNIVNCSSFAVWNNKSTDGSLLVGRNFDFYFGENFAQEKSLYFYKPDKGYRFMMVSWSGMIGAVSGMNEHGLTMTVNTTKSDKPFTARTPLCIIGREILQYASTIEEAFEIAKKRDTFISATFMITSSKENRAVIIEKSISKTCLYEKKDENFISSTNHFQDDRFDDDELNKDNIINGYSVPRLQRLNELIKRYDKIDERDIINILRNQKGISDIEVGTGNEKAVNHLSSHHIVVFKPAELKFWISSGKYQMGEVICYDMIKVFDHNYHIGENPDLFLNEKIIPADESLSNGIVENYSKYRDLENEIEAVSKKKVKGLIPFDKLETFIALNPALYKTYITIGDYYFTLKNYSRAVEYYETALQKEFASERERKAIKEKIVKCNKRLKK
jgi:isopenicillin-N N-acyltransferase like protein